MTTGNKVVNSQVLVNTNFTSDCYGQVFTGSGYIGSKWSKVWSGGNSPHQPKVPTSIDVFTYQVRDKKGKTRIKTVRVKRYPLGTRPKKTENAYNCDLQKATDVQMSDKKGCPLGTPSRTTTAAITSEFIGYGQPTISQVWGPNDDISLIGKLSDKISGEQFNMAVFLGEGKEALETIAQSARRIALSLKSLRRGNVFRAARTLLENPRKIAPNISRKHVTEKWLADNWLQLQYGWKPLVQDIFGAASHFAYMQNRPQVLTYRARKTIKPQKILSPSGSYDLSGTVSYGKTIKALVSKIDEIALLGLKDPASLAWELLPYSFVCDWVIPVGNYLEAINLQRSLAATYVTSWKYRYAQAGGTIRSGGFTFTGGFSRERVTVGRTVSSSLNVPLPVVKPWVKIDSWIHATNSIALLVNAVPRFFMKR